MTKEQKQAIVSTIQKTAQSNKTSGGMEYFEAKKALQEKLLESFGFKGELRLIEPIKTADELRADEKAEKARKRQQAKAKKARRQKMLSGQKESTGENETLARLAENAKNEYLKYGAELYRKQIQVRDLDPYWSRRYLAHRKAHIQADKESRILTCSTLKALCEKSGGDPKLVKLRYGLIADLKRLDYGLTGLISEGYDLYTFVYNQFIMVFQSGHVPGDTASGELLAKKYHAGYTDLYFNAKENRFYSFFEVIRARLNREINKHRALTTIDSTKTVNVTDQDGKPVLGQDGKPVKKVVHTTQPVVWLDEIQPGKDGSYPDMLERAYAKTAKGEFMEISSEEYSDYVSFKKSLELTSRENDIIHWIMQGQTIGKIAKRLDVSQQAVSKALARIQAKTIEQAPEKVRHFKVAREKAEKAEQARQEKFRLALEKQAWMEKDDQEKWEKQQASRAYFDGTITDYSSDPEMVDYWKGFQENESRAYIEHIKTGKGITKKIR